MNEKLLNNLVCPVTNTQLEWDKQQNRLVSREAKLAYPIQNGIPVLLPETGEKLED
ncbi:Trm112 family protein [Actinobacillus vicugnae]|uniref:Trm112 family protein n=1 Tax=Actinobacillus vicugnae TaxID=2573093 RepID=UPI001240C706|nr:Trm112 family protein [Actinobacillus vicugnae]